jgi:TPR repeat protein
MNKLLLALASLLYAAGFAYERTPAEISALREMAEKGDAKSQYELGVANYHIAAGGGGYVIKRGIGGKPANPTEAAKWFLKAAEQGHPEACYEIARMYDEGVGVISSGIEAGKWMKQYALKGISAGGRLEYIMGTFYAKDRPDLPKDEKESLYWYRKAAVLVAGPGPNETRFIEASRHALATYYSDSKAADFNLTKAYAWWSVSAVSGNATSAKKRDVVEQRLSSSEVKEGRAMAGQILKEIEALNQTKK